MHAASEPLLLTLDEAAKLLGLSAKTLKHWHAGFRAAPAGFPPPVALGKSLRLRRADIEAFVAGLAVAPASAIPPLPAPAAAAPTADELTAPRRGRGRPKKLGGGK